MIRVKECLLRSEKTSIQSNPINTDTEGTTESVRVLTNRASVLSGSCYLSKKKKDPFARILHLYIT